jgi:predicted lipoprotein with Yx(FWY)xxD motif
VAAVSACFLIAGMVSAAVVPKPTLQLAKHASVTDQANKTTVESIVVNTRGRAVYELSGDSARHPECTQAKGCFQFWPPVKVSSRKSLHKATGITGRLGTWRRNGFLQVTLNGHPLYRFFRDSHPRVATGEGVTSFGGTWHVLRGPGTSSSPGTPSPTTTSTSTSTTTSCLYPPCY